MNCITNRTRNVLKKKLVKKYKNEFLHEKITLAEMQSKITKSGNNSAFHKNKIARIISKLTKQHNLKKGNNRE